MPAGVSALLAALLSALALVARIESTSRGAVGSDAAGAHAGRHRSAAVPRQESAAATAAGARGGSGTQGFHRHLGVVESTKRSILSNVRGKMTEQSAPLAPARARCIAVITALTG